MFRATAHGLHGGPHVTIARGEIPTRGQELLSRNSSAVINPLDGASRQIGDHLRPNDVSVPSDYDVSATKFMGLFRIQSCVDTPYTTQAPRSRAMRPTCMPRRALPVWMPIPTMSPRCMS